MAKAKSALKETKSKKDKKKKEEVISMPEIKSKVLLKDKKFTRVIFGEDCLASVPISWLLEEIYEKTPKRGSYENFYKKWRPTILKMDGAKVSEIEKVILGG